MTAKEFLFCEAKKPNYPLYNEKSCIKAMENYSRQQVRMKIKELANAGIITHEQAEKEIEKNRVA